MPIWFERPSRIDSFHLIDLCLRCNNAECHWNIFLQASNEMLSNALREENPQPSSRRIFIR